MENQEEIWKDIPGYENLYQASNTGKIKRLPRIDISSTGRKTSVEEKLLIFSPSCKDKDYNARLYRSPTDAKYFKVSRLMLLTFKPTQGSHNYIAKRYNKDKLDNHIENLYWHIVPDTDTRFSVAEIYTQKEISYIRENMDELSIKEIAINLNRSPHGIREKLKREGFSKKICHTDGWKKKDIEILKEYAGKISHEDIGKLLNKTQGAVSAKAHKLKINSSARKGTREDNWTANELKILKNYYPVEGPSKLSRLLPGRTKQGITLKARSIGVVTEKMWTNDELEFLKNNYPKLTCYQIGKILKRSTVGINKKRLKLKLNVKKKNKITLPESVIMEFLKESKILYDFQYKVGRYITDFRIKNTNIIIEVQGDYWHGNTNVYKKLRSFQVTKIEKDKLRKEFIQSQGYQVIEIWEQEIIKELDIVKNKIKTIINGKG